MILSTHAMSQIGAVVIGRNEGKRLITCIESLMKFAKYIIYVDSGSTDDSIEAVKKIGIRVVSLDMSIPFTAARARNEGASYLLSKHLELKYLQFIDGDCELQANWMVSAGQFLDENDNYAIACGRRRERFPDKSVYNQLCDIEWNTPVGDALACGGDALIRVKAYKEVNGYRNDLIAGEEPEMCFRLRRYGWKIRRIDVEMTLHDAAITKLSQWWNRAKRSGYAYVHSYYLHGNSAEHFKFKEVRSIIIWALLIPMAIVVLTFSSLFSLVFILLYPAQIIKNTLKLTRLKSMSISLLLLFTTSNILAKFPQFTGIMMFVFNQIKGKEGRLIEYK